jgi:uncharacterized protein
MSSYFLDTSALVKRYHIEQGTAKVKPLFDDAENTLYISELALVESASAFQRRKNRGEMSTQAMSDALEKFDGDAINYLVVIGISRDLIERAKSLVLQHGLRTLDALQLAAALSLKPRVPVFVSADANLLSAAQANGLESLNPLE